MNVHACFIIFSVLLSFGCDAKSVSCDDASDKCENAIENEIKNSTKNVLSKKKNRLEELKENVGRVGNKLEGIVYEVLKDILQDDLESSGEYVNSTHDPNNLVKETETSTEIFLKKLHPAYLLNDNNSSSVIEDDVIHSNKIEKSKTTKFRKFNETSPNNYQLLATGISKNETSSINITSDSTNNNTTQFETSTTETVTDLNMKSTTEQSMDNCTSSFMKKLRKRRMSPEIEQSRSVENFMESNPEKPSNFPTTTVQLGDPMFNRVIPQPRQEMRQSSKDDVTREPKKEPTEDNRPKRPQDEVGMGRRLMPRDPSEEQAEKIANKNLPRYNIIDSTQKRKAPIVYQTSPRRKTSDSGELTDFSFQKNAGTKEASFPNKVNENHLASRMTNDFHFPNSENNFNQRGSPDISDFQLEMKKEPSNDDELLIQRVSPEKSKMFIPRNPTQQKVKEMHIPNEKTTNLRTVDNSQDDSRLGQSYGWGNPPSNCYEKNTRDDIMEKQHIEDLKYEVSKLRSVVDLLKEQQRLINSFDGDKKPMNTQEMMSVLNQLNKNNEKPAKSDKSEQYDADSIAKTKHEELGQIKIQLKEAIENLNRTKEILNLEHKKEMNLETELKTQRTEINWLKLIIENFIISQAKKKMKEEPSQVKVIEDEVKPTNETTIVGAKNPTLAQKKSHDRMIPSTVKMAEEKLMELEKTRSRESFGNDSRDREISRQLKNFKVSSPKARASGMSTLEKLLDNLSDKQSKSDDDESFQIRLLEAMKDLRKKKDEETSIKDIVRKLQLNSVESKSEDDNMLLKFQKALKALDNPQSKSDDLDIEDQLKVLQKEITKLKTGDDLSLFSGELKAPADDNAQLQLMLTKLIASNPQLQGMKLPPITPQQLMQLQKKFGKVPSGVVPPMMGGVGVPGDFSAAQPAFPGFGKIGPIYGPFGQGLGPYSSNTYGKDLDTTSSIGNYPSSYGLGQDLSKFMSYGIPQSNKYSPSNGYTGSNDFNGNNDYFGGNSYSAGGSYGSGPGSALTYSSHGPTYPISSPGLYTAPKSLYGVMSPYNNIYSSPYKAPYGKPQDVGYSMNPYSSPSLTYSNPTYGRKDPNMNDKPNYGNNNFFQVSQPNSYGSGPPSPYLPSKAIDASGPEKIYGNQPPYANANPPYPSDKIEELKTQIFALQNAISSYNRPEYTQTAEDKSTIYNLEQQIEELKGIVNSLNGYPVDQQNYGAPGPTQYDQSAYGAPNEPKNVEVHNRDSETKIKRSTQEYESSPEQKLDTVETKISQNNETHDHRGLWDEITSIFRKSFSSDSIGNERRRRSIDDNSVEDNASSNVMNKLTTVLREVLEDDPNPQAKPLFGGVPGTINSLSRTAENQQSNIIPKQTSLQDIKKQIDHLKKQLGTTRSADESADKQRTAIVPSQAAHSLPRHSILPEPSYGFNYALNPFATDLSTKPKKLDIFKEIVAKIMDKVIESLPVILQKLFGFAVHELTAYGDDYGASYGADSSYLSVFRNLGIFGYLPLILLRVVNAVSTFIYILQKNKFLKYFLVPAGVVLLVTGGMVFLIWWMQPGDFYVNYDKLSYDKEPSYGNDYYGGDYGKSNGQIVKTYGVDDGKSRLHTYNHAGDSKSLQPNSYPAFYKPTMVVTSDNQMPVYSE